MIPQILLTLTRFGRAAGSAGAVGARTVGRGAGFAGRGAVGAAKTLFVANLASSMADVDKSESELKNVNVENLGNVETPIRKSEVLESDTSQATLQFTNYVNQVTDQVEPIRPFGQPIPTLTVSNEQSQVVQDIIENINNIKKRLTNVEIKTRKQTSILLKIRSASMGLNETVKESIDTDRQNELELKRDVDEEQVERKGIGERTQKVFGKLKDYAENTGSLLKEYITKFGIPLALISAPSLVSRIGDETGIDDEIPEMTLSEIGEIVKDTSETAAGIGSSILGAVRGSATKQARILSSFTGRKRNLQYLKNIAAAKSYFTSLKNSASSIQRQIGRAALAFPPGLKNLVNKGAKLPRAFFTGIVIFEAMFLLFELYVSGLMPEDEFDRKMKGKISELIRVLGAPWFTAFIFGMVGTTALGLGGLVGASLGLLAGILLGDFVFELLGMETLVDAMYEAFVRGDYSKLKEAPGKIMNEMPDVIGEYVENVIQQANESIENITTAITGDEIASQELIDRRYGENATRESILLRASGQGRGIQFGIGFDDEDAILYAFKDVETPDDYLAIKENFENKTLPEYNEEIRGFGAPEYETMEGYLSDVLSASEYRQLKNQIRTQVSGNSSVTKPELEMLMDVIDRDTNLGFFEETGVIRRGEGIRVQYADGSKQILFEDEIRTSERIDEPTRERALRRLQENRDLIEDGFTPSASQTMIVPNQESETENRTNLVVMPQPIPAMSSNPSKNNQNAQHSTPNPTVSTIDPFIGVEYVT